MKNVRLDVTCVNSLRLLELLCRVRVRELGCSESVVFPETAGEVWGYEFGDSTSREGVPRDLLSQSAVEVSGDRATRP